jgi:hypothetical protein
MVGGRQQFFDMTLNSDVGNKNWEFSFEGYD